MNRLILLPLVTLLLASTTAVQAQDAAPTPVASPFTLTGTGGVMGFQLPAFNSGVFGHAGPGTIFGGMIAGNITGSIGKLDNGWNVLASLNVFGAYASGTSNFTDSFTGPGTVTITGLTTPSGGTGGSSITTSAGSSSTTNVIENDPQGNNQTGSASASGGPSNLGFVKYNDNSFILGGATSDGTDGSAYGAIADTSGGVFVGSLSGAASGINVSTSVQRQLTYVGADLTYGVAGQVNDKTSLQVYAGPSFRNLGQKTTTDVNVDVGAVSASAVTMPEFSMSQVENLDSYYLGGVLGADLSFVTSPGVVLSLGGEGGIYNVNASWNGTDTYSTCCGNFEDSTTNTVGPSPSRSVTSDGSSYKYSNTVGYAARANAGVTFAIGGNKALTLGGNVEYLSKVAQVTHNQTTFDDTSTTGGFNSGTPSTTPTSTFGWGHMLNYGATISLTGTF